MTRDGDDSSQRKRWPSFLLCGLCGGSYQGPDSAPTCTLNSDQRRANQVNRNIEKSLREERERTARDVKLLLLGAGESGKSTIVKQMQIIHRTGYNEEDCLKYKPVVYSNTVQSMVAIIRAMGKLSIPFSSPEKEEAARQFFRLAQDHAERESRDLSEQFWQTIRDLWDDSGWFCISIRNQVFFRCSHRLICPFSCTVVLIRVHMQSKKKIHIESLAHQLKSRHYDMSFKHIV